MKRAMCAPALISAASSTAPTASQASASMLLGESCKHGEATKQMKQQQLPPQSQREMTMDAHASTSTYAPSAIPSAKQAPDAFAYQQMMFPQQLFDLTFKKSEMKNYDMLNESIISSFFHDLMLYHMQNELPQKMAEAGISEHFATPYPEGSDLKTLPPNFYASGPTKCWYCKRDGSKERLILPCACDNTERLVHPSCLIECVNISNFCHCADCHYLFKLELKEDMKQWSKDKESLTFLILIVLVWAMLMIIPWAMILYIYYYQIIQEEAITGKYSFTFYKGVFHLLTSGTMAICFNKYWVQWRSSLYVLRVISLPGKLLRTNI